MDAISAMLRYIGRKPIQAHKELHTRPGLPPLIKAGEIINNPISQEAVAKATKDVIESCLKFLDGRSPVSVDFIGALSCTLVPT
jgi:hypothetical protein